jgi:membrane fusion protein (multidrug efflux system)
MRRVLLRLLLLVAVPIAAAVGGAEYYMSTLRYVTTQNAYVKSTVVAISAEVTGRIEQLLTRQNRRVAAGDLLFRIDPEPFRITLDKADAELSRVRNEIRALRADYRESRLELKEATGDIPYYRRAFDRQRRLAGKGHSSRARFDEAQRKLTNSRQRAAMLRQKSLRILAQLGGKLDLPLDAHADYRRARATRDNAELDLRRTMVHAPISGTVGPVRIEAGEYITAGTPAMPLISAIDHWVEANLKETQLTQIRIGQTVDIVIDAYPNRKISARVDSISPTTGAEMSILPPQNASGNWVKVVQRVPVRLALDDIQPPLTLRAGMTVSVSIDTGRDHSLNDLIGSALAWKVKPE